VFCSLNLPPNFGRGQSSESTAKLSDSDIQLLRSDKQASKHDIITATTQFTDAEPIAFWPIYRDYARDQQMIGDQRIALIKDYTTHYGTMDDNKAKGIVQRMINLEKQNLELAAGRLTKIHESFASKARRQVLAWWITVST